MVSDIVLFKTMAVGFQIDTISGSICFLQDSEEYSYNLKAVLEFAVMVIIPVCTCVYISFTKPKESLINIILISWSKYAN